LDPKYRNIKTFKLQFFEILFQEVAHLSQLQCKTVQKSLGWVVGLITGIFENFLF